MITSIIFGVLCTGIVICTSILTESWKKCKLGDFLFSCLAITAMSVFAIQCPIFPWSAFNAINTNTASDIYYLEAEPLAYNYEANLTYFTSAEGQFKAEGIYPENTYLLTMDNNETSDKKDDIVLVVWEPSKGEVG